MNRKRPTLSRPDELQQQLHPNTPPAIVSLIRKQLERANDAAQRIETEGSVVRDPRGTVIEHPAIAIERQATKTAAALIAKHKAPTRRPQR